MRLAIALLCLGLSLPAALGEVSQKQQPREGEGSSRPDFFSHEENTDAPYKRGMKWTSLNGSWGKRTPSGLQEEEESETDLEKSSPKWKNLRGSWGKRAGWKNLHGSWGKREFDHDDPSGFPSDDRKDKRRRWSSLQGSWGKRNLGPSNTALGEFDGEVMEESVNPSYDYHSLPEDPLPSLNKRSWSTFLDSWLKRRQRNSVSAMPRSNKWYSLRGSWGKRSVDPSAGGVVERSAKTQEDEDSYANRSGGLEKRTF